MRRPGAVQWLSILFTTVPFAFGLIRAAQTGVDFRYLWVALAALCGALAVVATGKTRGGKAERAGALVAGVFVAATLCAMTAASVLGVRVGPGMLVVAAAFAACFAAGAFLHVLARHRRP